MNTRILTLKPSAPSMNSSQISDSPSNRSFFQQSPVAQSSYANTPNLKPMLLISPPYLRQLQKSNDFTDSISTTLSPRKSSQSPSPMYQSSFSPSPEFNFLEPCLSNPYLAPLDPIKQSSPKERISIMNLKKPQMNQKTPQLQLPSSQRIEYKKDERGQSSRIRKGAQQKFKFRNLKIQQSPSLKPLISDFDSSFNDSILTRRSTLQSRDRGMSLSAMNKRVLTQVSGELTLSRRHQYSQNLAQINSMNQSQNVSKKTPFSRICKSIETNLNLLSQKIKSKIPFYHQVSKLLVNKSLHLQNVLVIHETQEIVTDHNTLDKALVGVVTSSEFKSSTFAQRGMIKNLLVELNIFNKDVFNLFLQQQKQTIQNLGEKISNEQKHVDALIVRLSNKHYPHFDKKANLMNSFAFKTMPITYTEEKYLLKEDQLGSFSLISQENRFIASKIDHLVATLTQRNYQSNNPFRKSYEQSQNIN